MFLQRSSYNESTLTDADQYFSSRQMLSSSRQNSLSDVRVDERDLELSFGRLNYSFFLFRHNISIENIHRSRF